MTEMLAFERMQITQNANLSSSLHAVQGPQGNPRPCHPQWGPLLTLNKLYVSNSHWNGPHPFAAMMPCNTFVESSDAPTSFP